MKAYIRYFGGLLFGLWTIISCKQQDNTSPCGAPNLVSVDTGCYTGKGLLVTASNYGGSPSSFDWTIIALKDTTNKLGWTDKDIKFDGAAPATFAVADSLVTNYQKLIITVASNCQGTLYHSIYYGFIKSKSATNTCIVWKPLKQ